MHPLCQVPAGKKVPEGGISQTTLSIQRLTHSEEEHDSQHLTPGSPLPLKVVTAPGLLVGCLRAEGTSIFAAVLKHNLVSCKLTKLLNRVQSVSIGILMF